MSAHEGAVCLRGAWLFAAAQFYDRCIAAIQDDPASVSSTWDC
jgi:hypothetical protein